MKSSLAPVATLLALFASAGACKEAPKQTLKQEPAVPSTAPSATGTASKAAAPITDAAIALKAEGTAHPESKPMAAADKKLLRSAIAEGRTLGKAGKWNEAVAAFSKVPDTVRDGVLLSELCYAAYKDANYTVAEGTCADARGLVHAPTLRAQVLFNSGLVAEAGGAWGEAAHYYEDSLSLRANAAVRKRLADVKTKAATKAPKESCDRSFPTLDEACACILRRRTDYLSPLALFDNAKGFCGEEKKPTSTVARLLRLAGRAEDESTDVKFLFLADGTSWKKMPVEAGNFEPGAFGVHNFGKFDRFEDTSVNGHPWMLVHVELDNNDYNLGGLELYASKTVQVTPCQTTPKPRCGMTITLKNEDSLSYDDHGSDMAPDERKEFESMKKNEYTHVYETALVLGDDGESYTVTLKSGDKSQVPPDLLGKHKM